MPSEKQWEQTYHKQKTINQKSGGLLAQGRLSWGDAWPGAEIELLRLTFQSDKGRICWKKDQGKRQGNKNKGKSHGLDNYLGFHVGFDEIYIYLPTTHNRSKPNSSRHTRCWGPAKACFVHRQTVWKAFWPKWRTLKIGHQVTENGPHLVNMENIFKNVAKLGPNFAGLAIETDVCVTLVGLRSSKPQQFQLPQFQPNRPHFENIGIEIRIINP